MTASGIKTGVARWPRLPTSTPPELVKTYGTATVGDAIYVFGGATKTGAGAVNTHHVFRR
ncbi:MAG TPA: hypothetical protein VGB36_03250 [Gammaproteobacteria bacterium]|jgi:hypothetical protein